MLTGLLAPTSGRVQLLGGFFLAIRRGQAPDRRGPEAGTLERLTGQNI